MKIAVVGCGALGCYYGAKLCSAGETVHFLLRSDYEIVRRHGVSIRSPEGNFNARPRCARRPEEIGSVDLVLIGLKTTANHHYRELLPPLVGARTAVLTLQNGLGNEEQLARLFPSEQILGGLCFVCLNRTDPGVVEHLGHGRIVLGEYQRWPEPRTHDIATLFRHAGVPCEVTDNLARAHWEKLVWNIPFNGLGVAGSAGLDSVRAGRLMDSSRRGPVLTTAQLLGDPAWEQMVRELMTEVVLIARAQGMRITDGIIETQIERTRSMGAYKASTLIDFERRRPLELESLFLEPLQHAKTAGVSVPRLQALYSIMVQLAPPLPDP